MLEDWALDIKAQCAEQEVAFFFKQWGTFGLDGVRRSKKLNGRELAGRKWEGMPGVKTSHSSISNF